MSKEIEKMGQQLNNAQFAGTLVTLTIAMLIFGVVVGVKQKIEKVNKARSDSIIIQKTR